MSNEREPRKVATTGAWAADGIAKRLGQAGEPRLDPTFGSGVEIPLAPQANAEHGERSVSLYPNEGVIFIQTPNASISLRNAAAPREARNGMLVETANHDARLLVLEDGHIALEVFPVVAPKPVESPAADQETTIRSETANMPEEWRIPAPVAPEDVADIALGQPKDSSLAAESGEHQKRIKVDGFVATEPNMRPTPTGKPRVQFLVAEHPSVAEGEEEVTVYHRVYTLNNTATRVIERGGLEKGKKVSVDGYLQPRIKKNRQNEDEEYNVVYALTIRTPQASKPFTPKPPMPGREPAPKE